jgi:hypothetical protein
VQVLQAQKWMQCRKKRYRKTICLLYAIISFPTKHHWRENSNIYLIKKSAEELEALIRYRIQIKLWDENVTILLPRPGCGNGGLNWSYVKPVIAPILSDNVTIISKQ